MLNSSNKNLMVIYCERILLLLKNNKFGFTFLYLKEVNRLLVQALSGNRCHSDPNKIRVVTDLYGLPKIIPHEARIVLRQFIDQESSFMLNVRFIRSILTLTSIYRVFPVKGEVDLGSITDPQKPFTSSTLEVSGLRSALRELIPNLKLNVKSSGLIGGESAGPNSGKSI